jgi:hypothetical protein
MMNSVQKKQLSDAARRETLDEVEKRATAIIDKHRGTNPMADLGATQVLVAVRRLRGDWGLDK